MVHNWGWTDLWCKRVTPPILVSPWRLQSPDKDIQIDLLLRQISSCWFSNSGICATLDLSPLPFSTSWSPHPFTDLLLGLLIYFEWLRLSNDRWWRHVYKEKTFQPDKMYFNDSVPEHNEHLLKDWIQNVNSFHPLSVLCLSRRCCCPRVLPDVGTSARQQILFSVWDLLSYIPYCLDQDWTFTFQAWHCLTNWNIPINKQQQLSHCVTTITFICTRKQQPWNKWCCKYRNFNFSKSSHPSVLFRSNIFLLTKKHCQQRSDPWILCVSLYTKCCSFMEAGISFERTRLNSIVYIKMFLTRDFVLQTEEKESGLWRVYRIQRPPPKFQKWTGSPWGTVRKLWYFLSVPSAFF